jgi:putative autotransporter adhesin-like protein
MKTLAKTLCASALTAIFLTSAVTGTFASAVHYAQVKPGPPFTFHRITITGNVTVILSQESKEKVTVDSDVNRTNVSVMRKGYTLMINSAAAERVTIYVSVKELQRIDASNEVVVKTAGKINVQHLQIFLKDQASAEVNANTESLYTYIRGNANLRLSGSTQDHIVLKDGISKLTLQDFVALKSTVESTDAELLAASKTKKLRE